MADDELSGTDFGAALHAAATRWHESFRHEMTARGFSIAGAAGGEVLGHLAHSEISQTALTGQMGLTKQAVQQLLDQLEAAGLVRREADPADKRAKQVSLTAAGQRALAERRVVEAMLEARARDTLGKKQFKKLRKALREIAAER